MNDSTACEVQRSELVKPATAPDPVCNWYVDKDCPYAQEDSQGLQLHALCYTANYQCNSDYGEHEFIHREQYGWNCARIISIWKLSHSAQHSEVEVADNIGLEPSKGKGITEDNPDQGYHTSYDDCLAEHRKETFLS